MDRDSPPGASFAKSVMPRVAPPAADALRFLLSALSSGPELSVDVLESFLLPDFFLRPPQCLTLLPLPSNLPVSIWELS